LRDLYVDGNVILRWIPRKQGVRKWTGFIRREPSGGIL